MYNKLRNKSGFTLVELAVVLVIIALLATVVTFSVLNWVDKAKEKTALSDIDTMQKEMTLEYIKKGDALTDAEIADFFIKEYDAKKDPESDNKYFFKTPSGGEYSVTIQDGIANIVSADFPKLSVVSPTSTDAVINYGSGIMNNQRVIDYFSVRKNQGAVIDSTGSNYGVYIKEDLKETLNLSNTDFDFRIWQRGDGTYDIYIFDSIAGKKSGDVVSATKFTYDKNSGTTSEKVTGSAPLKEKDGMLCLYAEKFK